MRKKRSGEDSLLYLNTSGARSLEGKRRDPRFSNECKKSIDRKRTKCYNHLRCRGIAQFGSALGSGPRGRRFKSCCSDHLCECSSMVERQPSKLVTRVRFPSPAPETIRSWGRAFLLSEITGACLSCIQGKGCSCDFPAFSYPRFRNMIR